MRPVFSQGLPLGRVFQSACREYAGVHGAVFRVDAIDHQMLPPVLSILLPILVVREKCSDF